MKEVFISILLIGLFGQIFGQTKPNFIPFKKDNLWGLCDSTKTILIEPQFEYVRLIESELAFVRKKGKCGLIKSNGKYQIPLEYDGFMFYKDTISWTSKNAKRLILTISGKEYEPEEFVSSTNWFKEGLSVFQQNGKYGVINYLGQVVVPCSFDSMGYSYNNGRINVRLGKKWSVLNEKGDLLFQPKYDKINVFSDSTAVVYDFEKGYGVIDSEGNEILPLEPRYISGFHEGLTYLNSQNRILYVNKKGEKIYQTRNNFCGLFEDGIAYVGNGISSKGINLEGKVIYRKLCLVDIDYYNEGMAVADNWLGRFGFIDTRGRRISKFKYDFAWEFNEGLGRVELDSLNGFLDVDGKLQIPIIYNEASDFKFGLALVKRDNKEFYINKAGDEFLIE